MATPRPGLIDSCRVKIMLTVVRSTGNGHLSFFL